MGSENKKNIKRKTGNSQLHTASDVLQSLLTNGKSGLSEQFQRWRLWREWAQVVGSELAKTTYPVGYNRGTLILWVDHPARIHDLHYLRDVLIKKVNQHLGRSWVQFLQFTTDCKAVPNVEESEQGLRDYLSKPLPNANGDPPLDR